MVKICCFADAHYAKGREAAGGRQYGEAPARLRKVLEEPADVYVNLGDLIDGGAEAASWYREMRQILAPYPCWHLAGNHDAFALTAPQLPGCGFAVHDLAGLRWILLDANYDWEEKPYGGRPGDWTKAWIPAAQQLALQQALKSCTDAVVLCHQDLDDRPGDPHIVGNAAEVRRILEDSGKVRMVVQGHYHPGADSVIGGIPYHTLPALCNAEHAAYAIMTIEIGQILRFEYRKLERGLLIHPEKCNIPQSDLDPD